MFELNGTYIIFIASFLVFMFLLNEIMLKPVGKAIADRKALIQEHQEISKISREKAEAELISYKERLNSTRHQAAGIRNEASAAAQKVRDAKLKEVQDEEPQAARESQSRIGCERKSWLKGWWIRSWKSSHNFKSSG